MIHSFKLKYLIFTFLFFDLSCTYKENNKKEQLKISKQKLSFNFSINDISNYSIDSILIENIDNCNSYRKIKVICYKPKFSEKLSLGDIYDLSPTYGKSSYFPIPNYDSEVLLKHKGIVFSNKKRDLYYAIDASCEFVDDHQLYVKRVNSITRDVFLYNIQNGFKGEILSDTILKINNNGTYMVFESLLKKNRNLFYKRIVFIYLISNIKLALYYTSEYKDEKDLLERSWEAKKLMENTIIIAQN